MENPCFFTKENIETIVRNCAWNREYAATDWRDGMFLGNGSHSMISYVPGSMEWVINKNDVFDRRVTKVCMAKHKDVMERVRNSDDKTTYFLDEEKVEGEKYTIRSLSCAIVRIYDGGGELGWSAPAFEKVSQSLSLWEGILKNTSCGHFAHSTCESFVARNTDVCVIRIDGCSVSDRIHKVELYRPHNDALRNPDWVEGEGCELCFTQSLPENIGSYAVCMKIAPRSGGEKRINYSLPDDFDVNKIKSTVSQQKFQITDGSVMLEGDADIFISVCSSIESNTPFDTVLKRVRTAANLGFDKLKEENCEFWKSFWEKSAVSFGMEKRLENYWYFSEYILASSYQKAPIPALSGMVYGPLNASIPGVGSHNYVHDQNVQIPLFPAPVINHTEFIEPLFETYLNAIGILKKQTRELFESDGIYIPLVTNQEGRELPSFSYRYTLCGSAYVGLVLCRTWVYAKDEERMRKFYPLLCELIKFYTSALLHKKADGLYHLDASVPPEIFYFTQDDTATLSMLRACIITALDFEKAVNIKNNDDPLWEDIISNFPPLAKRGNGSWWGGSDIPEGHFTFGTHLLYPFFPSEQYIDENGKFAAKMTIEYIDNYAIERSYACANGWHFVHDWSHFLYDISRSRIENNKNLFSMIHCFLDEFAKENGLFTHNSIVIENPSVTEENHKKLKPLDAVTADMTTSPEWYGSGKCATPNKYAKMLTAPVIEGNAILLMCASELLLQSYDNVIRVFSGVDKNFSGKFYNLIAKGGFKVSANMENGILEEVVIEALCDGLMRFDNTHNLTADKAVTYEADNVCLHLKKNECVVFRK